MEMVTLSVYFNVEAIVRHYHAYQSVSITVGKKTLPCQGKGANSEDLFAVAVMTGELIIGREKFPQFLDSTTNKSIYCRYTGSLAQTVLDSSALKFLVEKFLRKQIFATLCLTAKKSRKFLPHENFPCWYTVLQLYKLGVEFNRRGYHEDGQTTCGSIQV